MRRLFCASTLAITLAALPLAAAAQDSASYVRVHAGAFVVVQDGVEIDGPIDEGLDSSYEYDPGFAIGALAGREITPALAVEAELTFRSNDSDEITFEGEDGEGGSVSAEIDPLEADVFAVMANAVYRFGGAGAMTPYVGGGVGYADVWGEDDVEGAFAYQAKAGATFEAGGPGLFGVEASYFGAADIEAEPLTFEYGGITLLATYAYGF